MAGEEAVLFKPGDFRGPTCLSTGKPNAEAERKIGGIMAGYSKDKKKQYRIKKQITGGDESIFWVDRRFFKEEAAEFQIGR
jgi:hypothetical protein